MIRVVIADDENLTRDAVSRLLSLEDDIDVVMQCENAEAAVQQVIDLDPDVAVLDIDMPGDGLWALKEIRRCNPEAGTIMLTRHARPGVLRQSLQLGVRGFVAKSTSGADLAQIVRRVAGGGRYIDPDVAHEALVVTECPLSARELDVLALVDGRHTTSDLATALNLSPGTVRNYLSSAGTKLNVASRQEAADIARSKGWI